eukprot:1161782-Pelagomonas_calceolata.AAC.14
MDLGYATPGTQRQLLPLKLRVTWMPWCAWLWDPCICHNVLMRWCAKRGAQMQPGIWQSTVCGRQLKIMRCAFGCDQ